MRNIFSLLFVHNKVLQMIVLLGIFFISALCVLFSHTRPVSAFTCGGSEYQSGFCCNGVWVDSDSSLITDECIANGDLVFFDRFEYAVGKNQSNAGDVFRNTGGWGGFKDMTTSNPGAGGYIYTVTAIPGYSGMFPGIASSRAVVLESRAGTEAPDMGFQRQTDFYLQYGSEAGSVGAIPADVWFQFWIYNNDYGDERSQFNRSNKWLYPTRTYYPATTGSISWLVGLGTASSELDGRAWIELGNGADAYIASRMTDAVFSGATEVPTNQDKLGSNLSPNSYIRSNTWTLVKIHIDTSGAQGVYEMWLKELGGDWVKTTEWVGAVTPEFTWPIPSNMRDGHKMLRMPTTMTYRIDQGSGGDSWTYMDDFAIATAETALPTYGDEPIAPSPTDTTPPTRSQGSPTGTLSQGTRSATLSVRTDENATCKYGTTNAIYTSLPNTFSTTGGTTHSATITGLADGTTYTHYVRCRDGEGNMNTNAYTVQFSVANSTTSGGASSSGNGTDDEEEENTITTTTQTKQTKTATTQKTTATQKEVQWAHVITPEQNKRTNRVSATIANRYGVPYFTYRGVNAMLLKAYKTNDLVILVAGSGSRLQKIEKTGVAYKENTTTPYSLSWTGIWPTEDNFYLGKAYYILHPSDPLYNSVAFGANMKMNLPGCDNATCSVDGWILQEVE